MLKTQPDENGCLEIAQPKSAQSIGEEQSGNGRQQVYYQMEVGEVLGVGLQPFVVQQSNVCCKPLALYNFSAFFVYLFGGDVGLEDVYNQRNLHITELESQQTQESLLKIFGID